MSDETAAAKSARRGKDNGKGKGSAVANTPEARITRILAASLWRESWKAANPDAGPEVAMDAWKADRKQSIADARKLIRKLQSKGIVMTLAETRNAATDDKG